jgi:Flp pilus assembly protein TadG
MDQKRERDRASRRPLLRRFAGSRDGTAAIEFGLLILPFAALVLAILESCVSFAAQEILSNATDAVARELRTGQTRADQINDTDLRNRICERLEFLVADGCPGLDVDLRTGASFADLADVPIDYRSTDYNANEGPLYMLRVYYRWPILVDYMRKSMATVDDDKTLLFATAAWQNEPFN